MLSLFCAAFKFDVAVIGLTLYSIISPSYNKSPFDWTSWRFVWFSRIFCNAIVKSLSKPGSKIDPTLFPELFSNKLTWKVSVPSGIDAPVNE